MRRVVPVRALGTLALVVGTPLGLVRLHPRPAPETPRDSVNVLATPLTNLALPAPLARPTTCRRTRGHWRCAAPCRGHAPHSSAAHRCFVLAINALRRGRRAEHLSPLVLPSDYARLSSPERLFVLVDLERIARGIPPLAGLSAALDQVASQAAATRSDPTPSATNTALPARAMGATWAGGQVNVAAAVFAWIYSDGWQGSATTNVDCGAPGAAGCWEHRRILLGEATGTRCRTCVAGSAATVTVAGHPEPSYAFVIERPRARAALVFSWNRDVLPHLTARAEQVSAP